MKSWELRGGTLEFDEETHTYIYEGLVIPSVTALVSKVVPNGYENIPKSVLDEAAQKGTYVHKCIEMYEQAGELADIPELRNYMWLKKQYGFECVDNEMPVVIIIDGKAVCAGQLDMITRQDDLFGVEDIKRKSTIDKNSLFLQLNWYAIGVKQCYGMDISYLKCLQLREEKRKRIDIPLNEEKSLHILKEIVQC